MSGQFIRRFGARQRELGMQTAIFGEDVAQVFLASEMVENETRGTGLYLTWVRLETSIRQELSPLMQEPIGKPVVH